MCKEKERGNLESQRALEGIGSHGLPRWERRRGRRKGRRKRRMRGINKPREERRGNGILLYSCVKEKGSEKREERNAFFIFFSYLIEQSFQTNDQSKEREKSG